MLLEGNIPDVGALSLPFARGASLTAPQPAVRRALDAVPDGDCRALVVSAGYDTCEGDPFGGLSLHPEDLQPIGQAIASLGLPTVVVQEGGSVVDLLGGCAQALMAGLLG